MFLLSGLIGAVVGSFLTFGFNMWKFHRDERTARCDELCKAIWDVGQLAAEYWSKNFGTAADQAVSEAKLFAAQILVDGLYADFRGYLPTQDQHALDEALADLLDALTGGEFSVPNRAPDIGRLNKSAQAASATIVAIRRTYRQSLPFHRLATSYHENRRRTLDLPTRCSDRC